MLQARPLQATLALARRVDAAEIDFCALAGSHASAGLDQLEVAGGRALFGSPGSPLNKVLGLGLHGPVSDADLDRLESFYRERECPAQVELCPLAAADLPARLVARGFVPQGFENQLGRLLDSSIDALEWPTGLSVSVASPDQEADWLRTVASGFVAHEPHVGGGPESEAPPLDVMLGVMSGFAHPSIRRTLACVEGQLAGGVATWLQDGVLGIFGSATLPGFRRRGVQTALTVEALRGNLGRGDLAIATTAPGSTSQRTFERLGFRVLYTRAIFVKGFQS